MTLWPLPGGSATGAAQDQNFVSLAKQGGELEETVSEILAEGLPPTGKVGGVLKGELPNPEFAVDMATQAELEAAIAALELSSYVKGPASATSGSLAAFDGTTGKLIKVAGKIVASQIEAEAITTELLAANSITSAKIKAGTIEASDIKAATITSNEIASATITSGNIASGTITGGNIASGTVTAGNITVSKLSALSADLGEITAGTVTGATLRTAASGKRVVIDSEGLHAFNATEAVLDFNTTTGNLKVKGAIEAGSTVPATTITGTIIETQVGSEAISATKIKTEAIETSKLKADAVTSAKIAANTIVAGDIAAETITATQIAATTITGAKIAAGTIAAEKLTVSELSAITANLGKVTAGTIEGNTIKGSTIEGTTIIIPSGTKEEAENVNRLRWLTEGNASGEVMSYVKETGKYSWVGMRSELSTAENAVTVVTSKSKSQGFVTGIQGNSGTSAANSYVQALASGEVPYIIKGDGSSNFLQLTETAKRKVVFGESTITFTGPSKQSETKSITHGLGVKPTFVGLTLEAVTGETIVGFRTTERTSTVFKVFANASSTLATTLTFTWIAIG